MATTTQADIDETERQHLEAWNEDTDSEDYTDGSAELVKQGKIEEGREYEEAWEESEPAQAEAKPVTVPSTVETKDVQPAPPEPTAKHAKFGDAFKAARAKHLNDGGPATFDWNGKSYTTRLKGEAPSKPTASTTAKASPASTPKEPPTTAPDTPTQSVAPTAITATSPSEPAAPAEATPPPASKHSQIHVPGPSGGELKLHRIKLQKAYDDWQSAKSENTTWYGGRAVMRPGMAERQAEAEERYLRLLKNPV